MKRSLKKMFLSRFKGNWDFISLQSIQFAEWIYFSNLILFLLPCCCRHCCHCSMLIVAVNYFPSFRDVNVDALIVAVANCKQPTLFISLVLSSPMWQTAQSCKANSPHMGSVWTFIITTSCVHIRRVTVQRTAQNATSVAKTDGLTRASGFNLLRWKTRSEFVTGSIVIWRGCLLRTQSVAFIAYAINHPATLLTTLPKEHFLLRTRSPIGARRDDQ